VSSVRTPRSGTGDVVTRSGVTRGMFSRCHFPFGGRNRADRTIRCNQHKKSRAFKSPNLPNQERSYILRIHHSRSPTQFILDFFRPDKHHELASSFEISRAWDWRGPGRRLFLSGEPTHRRWGLVALSSSPFCFCVLLEGGLGGHRRGSKRRSECDCFWPQKSHFVSFTSTYLMHAGHHSRARMIRSGGVRSSRRLSRQPAGRTRALTRNRRILFSGLPQNLWVQKRGAGSAPARQEGLPSHLHLRSAPVK
jgi:hypothetical protein